MVSLSVDHLFTLVLVITAASNKFFADAFRKEAFLHQPSNSLKSTRTKNLLVFHPSIATNGRNDVLSSSIRSPNIFSIKRKGTITCSRIPRLFVSTNDNEVIMDDDTLLKTVSQDQLIGLCEQYELETTGPKEILLERLRGYASEQAAIEKKRLIDRKSRIENGGSHSREKYEIIKDKNNGGEDEDGMDIDSEGYFYFDLPKMKVDNSNKAGSKEKELNKKKSFLTSADITAPPLPPNTVPDENNEVAVKSYSTSDKNDLTGVASAQPGSQFSENALLSGETGISSGSARGGDVAQWDTQQMAAATVKEIEEAKEIVTELVHSLLAMTGAPAFREEFSGGVTPYSKETKQNQQRPRASSSPQDFIGFDPSNVPSDILTSSSKALRTNRGQVLKEVIDEYELRAIGYDGMAEDDKEKGGGHYREVSKVRAFLEGYRRAEVQRIARETTAMFLDKLVMEGIEGLDLTLSSMIRSSDDTADVGELNDALIDYLNDAIRQQEKKVEQIVGFSSSSNKNSLTDNGQMDIEIDKTAGLWNITENEDGQRIESLDPNDPAVKSILEKEYEKSKKAQEGGDLAVSVQPTPDTAQEQLLLLLCLLRDRIKAEAAFGNDEKGRNLRILAYCLHTPSNEEREQIILKEMGTSLSRIESFLELLDASIEYTESTSTQLKPGATGPTDITRRGGSSGMLNLHLLKSIKGLTEEIKDRQAWKASTGGTQKMIS